MKKVPIPEDWYEKVGKLEDAADDVCCGVAMQGKTIDIEEEFNKEAEAIRNTPQIYARGGGYTKELALRFFKAGYELSSERVKELEKKLENMTVKYNNAYRSEEALKEMAKLINLRLVIRGLKYGKKSFYDWGIKYKELLDSLKDEE